MRVLYHLSHHSAARADGWSGAPGEAAWVRDLVARIVPRAAAANIAVTTVDGDLEDHAEFHRDWDAFVAPHYEADLHNTRGAFWGRAASSATARQDDALGELMWAGLQRIHDAPPAHFEWSNPNVTDYYGFRLTSAKTPGVLIEHGVGWRRPDDFAWLRDNIDAIADAHVRALISFGGVPMPEFITRDQFDAYRVALERQLRTDYVRKEELIRMGVALPPAPRSRADARGPKLRELTPAQKRRDGHGTARTKKR